MIKDIILQSLQNQFQVLELTQIIKRFRVWFSNCLRYLVCSKSGSSTEMVFLAVLGPVLQYFCPRVRLSGIKKYPGTTLLSIIQSLV